MASAGSARIVGSGPKGAVVAAGSSLKAVYSSREGSISPGLPSDPPAHRFTVSSGGHRASQVPGEPQSVHALLFDPCGMGHARPLRHAYAAFRRLESVGSRDVVISGLYHTAGAHPLIL